jgi:hypothetical protein
MRSRGGNRVRLLVHELRCRERAASAHVLDDARESRLLSAHGRSSAEIGWLA